VRWLWLWLHEREAGSSASPRNDRKKSKGKSRSNSNSKGKSNMRGKATTARATVMASMGQREYAFYVYILSSRSRNLYVGMTNNLGVRIGQHREKREGTHTARYSIHRLVYFERFQYVRSAIQRETELKMWMREKKIALIEKVNPTWEDLAADW
jgi:putative endonuclease